MSAKLKALLTHPGFLIGGVTLLAYLPVFQAGLFYDDQEVLFASQEFFSLSQTFKRFLFIDRPLVHLSYRLDYLWSGFSPWGFHLTSLLIHLLVTAVVYKLAHVIIASVSPRVIVLEKRNAFALAVTLLFAIHPIQTESVAYVAGRSSSLAALFYLLAFYFFVRFTEGQKLSKKNKATTIDAVLVLVFLVCGYWSKETIFSFPLIAAGWLWFTGGKLHRPVKITLGIIGLCILGGVGLKHRVLQEFLSSGQAFHYLMTQWGVFWRYVGLIFFPFNQNLDHAVDLQTSVLNPTVWLAGLAYAALWVGAFILRKKLPLVAFGGFWFLATLLPESSIVPIPDVMVERRLYLPSFGFFLATVGLFAFYREFKTQKQWSIALAMVAIFFAALTFKRNLLYSDAVTMWKDVVTKSPHKIRGYINLGATYLDRQEWAGAQKTFLKALAIAPENALVLSNLGTLADRTGNKLEAFAYFQKAESLAPKDPLVIYNFARLLYEAGDTALAQEKFERVVKLNPYLPFGYFGQALVAERQGHQALALAFLHKSLEANPCFADALVNIGNTHHRNARMDLALTHYDQALKCDPTHGTALLNRAQTRFGQRDFSGARSDYLNYLTLNPYAWLPHYKMGVIFLLEKNEAQGRIWLEKALPLAQGDEALETSNLLARLNSLK